MRRVRLDCCTRIATMLALVSMNAHRFAATAWIASRTYVVVRHVVHHQEQFPTTRTVCRLSSTNSLSGGNDNNTLPSFTPGDKIQIEILSFGPLGASVDVVAPSHDEEALIAPDAPALGSGLILQKEIVYFRQARGNIDVVRGEILPAYVERVRETGKVDVSLRAYGGEAKADIISQQIMDMLQQTKTLPIGDKSDPQEIERFFPGVSKKSFKRALSSLFKQRLVMVDKFSVSLVDTLGSHD